MKKYLIFFLVSAFLVGINIFQHKKIETLERDLNYQIENVRAYEAENSNLNNEKRVFKMTIDQLASSKDSIFLKLRDVQKELKIKDNRIAQLQYQLSTASRTDTLILRDTIFYPEFKLDTVLGDKWFSQKLHMEYPSTIVSTPEITLENYVLLKDKKETVKPRKKFFLWRWFQKKHWITEVEVVEKNIYVKDSISRFVIIKE